MLLAKSKLNSMEVLISKTLIDSNINHHKFVLINNKFLIKYFIISKKKSKIPTTNKSSDYI